jgi:polysaccharide export outer membrane protein
LRVGLVLKISVVVGDEREGDEHTRQISDKGEIMLPLIGRVACVGMTLPQLKARLTELYGQYLREPDVTVDFVYGAGDESPWGKVRVTGRVRSEGWYNIPPTRDMTVLRAIQLAGGYDTSAKRSAVKVTRVLADGKKKQFALDLEALGSKGDVTQDIRLEPNDVVYVPEQGW